MNQINLIGKRFAFCGVCGKCLGEYRQNCAQEHLEDYPSHDDFMVMTLTDPLTIQNPDVWFKEHKITPDHIDPTILDKQIIRRRFDRALL